MSMQTALARSLIQSTYLRKKTLSIPGSVFHPKSTLGSCKRRLGTRVKQIRTQHYESTRTLPQHPVLLEDCKLLSRNKLSTVPGMLQSGDLNTRLRPLQQSVFVPTMKFSRNFSVSVQAENQFGLGGNGKSSELHTDNAPRVRGDWAVRLSNENAYLSWCRNTYLSTVVGIAMMGEGTTILAQQAGEGAFFLAGMNLSWGTFQFIYNTAHLRQAMGMSLFGGLVHISFAVTHFILWLMVCTLYIGYSDDPDMRAIEEETRKQKRRKAKKESG